MKTIKKDELFKNLSEFLNAKGVELKDGDYARRINRACGVLTDAINGTQTTIKRATEEVDQKLSKLRQTIHEATAPTPPAGKAGGKAAGGKEKKTARPKAKSATARKSRGKK